MAENRPLAGDKNSNADSHYVDAETGLIRQLWNLAAPAFIALIAPPLMVLFDAMMVGSIDENSLAALAAASSGFTAVLGLSIFMLYQTTSMIANADGAGATTSAKIQILQSASINALAIGGLMALLGFFGASKFTHLLGLRPEVALQAITWLQIASWAFPAVFIGYAATGYFRGIQNNRFPSKVVVLQVALNAILVGIWITFFDGTLTASAISLVIAEWLAAGIFFWKLRDEVRHFQKIQWRQNLQILRFALPLVWRSIALRIVLSGITWIAAGLGTAELAAFHLSFSIWMLLSLSLDALAIAAQILVGNAVGAKAWDYLKLLYQKLRRWSFWLGVIQGIGLILFAAPVAKLLAPTTAVEMNLISSLIVIGIFQPIAALVFLLDGIFFGLTENQYLAKSQTWALLGFIPVGVWIWQSGAELNLIWGAVGFWLLLRGATLWWRAEKLITNRRELTV